VSDVLAEDDLVWEITPVHLKLWITTIGHKGHSVYRISTWYLTGAPFAYEKSQFRSEG